MMTRRVAKPFRPQGSDEFSEKVLLGDGASRFPTSEVVVNPIRSSEGLI